MNATVPRKKHREVAAKGADCGAASTDVSSSRLKRNVAREAARLSAPNRKRARIAANLAGPALTEKLFSSPKRMPGRDARNVTDPKKKRARIAKGRLFGAAWMDRLSN